MNSSRHSRFAVYVMKLSLVQLILSILLTGLTYAIPGSAQELLKRPVTLQADNQSVGEILTLIERAADVRFVYSPRVVQAQKKLTISVHNERLSVVLTKLFRQLNISWDVVGGQIILKKGLTDQHSFAIPAPEIVPEEPNTDHILTGTVVDAVSNQPLPGVSIVLKGTTRGTTADANGKFSFNAPDEAITLVFSFVGYVSQEIAVGSGQTTLQVVLKADVSGLTEVVVTGYSTQRRKDLTGAVSVIKTSELINTPAAGVDQALQGKTAGVTVLNSGQPGGGVAVRIRGVGTINSNDPLYIIDGIPVTGTINTINPTDIESMQVLKDASSASIYGARAANGVIIITTKKGRKNEATITYDGYSGLQQAAHLPSLLDATQYGQTWFQALKNAKQTIAATNIYGPGPDPVTPAFLDQAQTQPAGNTNWLKTIFRPAFMQSHNLSMLNGTSRGNSTLSLGYFNQQGILESTNFTRYSLRFNSDYSFFNRLKVGENVNLSYTNQTGTTENQALGSPIISAFNADPLLPVYTPDGSFAGPSANFPVGTRNPLSALKNNENNSTKRWRVLGNVFAELTLGSNLTLRSSYAVDYLVQNGRFFSPTYAEGTQVNTVNTLSVTSSNTLFQTFTNTIQYKLTRNRHAFDVLAGTEYIGRTTENTAASRQNFPGNDPAVQQLSAGQTLPTNSGSAAKSALFSQFGKINYAYADRLLASFTLRHDATSRLANGRNGQVFPAVSAGWQLADERFFAPLRRTIDELKLRVGWGQNGNQEIDDYGTFSTYGPNLTSAYYDLGGTNNASQPGYTQSQIGNPLLRWETTTQTNLGLDAAAFNNKLTLTLDLFDKRTRDLLVQMPLPATVGASTPPYVNGGSMQNRGVEIALGYRNRKPKFSYSVDANATFLQNRLTELAPQLSYIASPVSNDLTRTLELQRTVVGQPIASFYGYTVLGIFQNQAEVDAAPRQSGKAIGRFRYADINGDGVVDDKDRQFLGSPLPSMLFSTNLRFQTGGFDFWLFFQGASGNKIYDFTRFYTDFFANNSNKSTRVLNAWTPDNPTASLPQLTTSNDNNETRPSTYFLQSGNYLRLKTLQIGYTLPKHNPITAKGIRFYAQAQNLFTFTAYTGLDPEVGLQNYTSGQRNLDIGVDRGIYPVARTFTVGVNAAF